MKKPDDKRTSNRVKTLNFRIAYMLYGTKTIYQAEVINLSVGGICFLRQSMIKKGDQLILTFPFRSKKIALNASVSRVIGREVAVKFHKNDKEIDTLASLFNAEYELLFKQVRDGKLDKLERLNSKRITEDDTATDYMLDIDIDE